MILQFIINAQNMKISMKDFFNKCDQIRGLWRIWPHLLKKSLIENFIFCAVHVSEEGPLFFILSQFPDFSSFPKADFSKKTIYGFLTKK